MSQCETSVFVPGLWLDGRTRRETDTEVDLSGLLRDLDDAVRTELASTPELVDKGDAFGVDDLPIAAWPSRQCEEPPGPPQAPCRCVTRAHGRGRALGASSTAMPYCAGPQPPIGHGR